MILIMGMKGKEVAALMGITPAAVSQRYHTMMEQVVRPYFIKYYTKPALSPYMNRITMDEVALPKHMSRSCSSMEEIRKAKKSSLWGKISEWLAGEHKSQEASFVEEFGSILQQSINELRSCYGNLIKRIEQHLVQEFGLTSDDYGEYILDIRKRLADVKVYLLTEKQKEFYNRVLTRYESRKEWYESVCYTILGKQLDSMKDEEEEKLLNDFVYMMRVCEKYADITNKTRGQKENIAYSFDLVSNRGTNLRTQTFVLPKTESEDAVALEKQIENLLSGEDNLDVCALLAVLNKRLG